MSKTVKARKQHVCNSCGKTIQHGENHIFAKWRGPVYGSDEEFHGLQVGIEYLTLRLCKDAEMCNSRQIIK